MRIAGWDDAHSGLPGAVRMPRNVNLEAAHVGHANLDDGSALAVANLPMGTMHAKQGLTAAQAAAMYENTGTSVARVRYSIDETGIRADGMLFDDVDQSTIDRLVASAPSGDWRALSMVRRPEDFEHTPSDFAGACIVNIPGYSSTFSQSPATPMRLVASADSMILFDGEPEMDSLVAAAHGYGMPIAGRDLAWDGAAAQHRMRVAATDAAGNVDFAKYGKGFLYHDHENLDKLGGYKLPYADVIDGKLTIVPRGVFAAAGVLSGARGGADLGDQTHVDSIKHHVAALYSSMSKKFNDKTIKVPWGDSAMTASAIDESTETPDVESGENPCADGPPCDGCTCGRIGETPVEADSSDELTALRASVAANLEQIDALLAAAMDPAMDPAMHASCMAEMEAMKTRMDMLEQILAEAILST